MHVKFSLAFRIRIGSQWPPKKAETSAPDAGFDVDVRFVSEVAVSLFNLQIEIRLGRLVPQLLPVDSVLDAELNNSLTSTASDYVYVTPDIGNLSKWF